MPVMVVEPGVITGSCEPAEMGPGNRIRSFGVLLTPEPSLQPLVSAFPLVRTLELLGVTCIIAEFCVCGQHFCVLSVSLAFL